MLLNTAEQINESPEQIQARKEAEKGLDGGNKHSKKYQHKTIKNRY